MAGSNRFQERLQLAVMAIDMEEAGQMEIQKTVLLFSLSLLTLII